MTGVWPKNQIDHDDHVRNNNRWANLKETTHQENAKNKSLYMRNKSGVSGVRLYKDRWVTQITVNKKQAHLGSFTDFFEACCARKSAEHKYSFHINHGVNPK